MIKKSRLAAGALAGLVTSTLLLTINLLAESYVTRPALHSIDRAQACNIAMRWAKPC